MDRGRRLAIDVGTVRIGLAVCDPEGILSSPLPALGRSEELAETLQVVSDLVLTFRWAERLDHGCPQFC
jgi:putative holliday junction resolvase